VGGAAWVNARLVSSALIASESLFYCGLFGASKIVAGTHSFTPEKWLLCPPRRQQAYPDYTACCLWAKRGFTNDLPEAVQRLRLELTGLKRSALCSDSAQNNRVDDLFTANG